MKYIKIGFLLAIGASAFFLAAGLLYVLFNYIMQLRP